MAEVLDRANVASDNAAAVGLTDRRRPGRMANPSPELIALMRKPSAKAIRELALYDAPGFVMPEHVADRRISPAHFGRVSSVILGCAGGWAGAFALMIAVWG